MENMHTRERTMDRSVDMARRQCESQWRSNSCDDTASISTTSFNSTITPRQFSDRIKTPAAAAHADNSDMILGKGDFLRLPDANASTLTLT